MGFINRRWHFDTVADDWVIKEFVDVVRKRLQIVLIVRVADSLQAMFRDSEQT